MPKPSIADETEMVPPGFVPLFPNPGADGFFSLIGPIYRAPDAPEGEVRFGFRAQARHTNPYGVLHGGLLMTVIDTVMGSLVFNAIKGEPCATISLTCDFIGAGRAGEWIEGEASLTRLGRAVAFTHAKIWTGEKLLLTASGKWAIISPR